MRHKRPKISYKRQSIFLWLAFLFGQLGIHNFYIGQFWRGIVKVIWTGVNVLGLVLTTSDFNAMLPKSSIIVSAALLIPLLMWIIFEMMSTNEDVHHDLLKPAPNTKSVLTTVYVVMFIAQVVMAGILLRGM